MKIEINEKDLLKMIDKEYLTDCIADKIISLKANGYGEFDDHIVEAFRKAQSEIIKTYMTEYYEGINLKRSVTNALEKLTRDEIISALSSKL